MSKFHQIKHYINYYIGAKTKYKVDSPFLYEFATEVLDSDKYYYIFEDLEELREGLLEDEEVLEVTDFGAGSHISKTNSRSIKSIAKNALSSIGYGQLLFEIVHHYKPKHILELGTSLGVSTLYMYYANEGNRIITLEGCPNIAGVAQECFDMGEARNVELRVGNFDDTLDSALLDLKHIDLAFIDGNHREQPTIDYFEKCLNHVHADSILIFDDIYWSKGMTNAWEYIKAHPKTKITIDLYQYGIVFFKKEQKEKQHIKLIQTAEKPFQWGFFR